MRLSLVNETHTKPYTGPRLVESFITDLHCLAEHCEFRTLKDQLIRDRIVVGLRNKQLSEKLQLDPDLTLEKVIWLKPNKANR